jgi:hypothetical protein
VFQGGASEAVATRLNQRIREHLEERDNVFLERGSAASSFHRPRALRVAVHRLPHGALSFPSAQHNPRLYSSGHCGPHH